MLCIGHRGAKGNYPENTLLSFEKAIEMGVHGVEFDVWVVEGEAVIIHDHTLERTTNGSGRTDEQSFKNLRGLDAGQGQQVPTLQEVLDLVDRRVFCNVELKGPNTAETVVRILDQYVTDRGWSYYDFLVSSFDHEQLELVRKLQPKLPLGVLVYGLPKGFFEFSQQINASTLVAFAGTLSQTLLAEAHERGLKVFVYGVAEHSNRELDLFFSWGVDAIIADYPERIITFGQ